MKIKQKIWLVYGLDYYAEYTSEAYIVDICLTENAAVNSLREAEKEEPENSFWIEEGEAHD